MTDPSRRPILIAGPTASGKSAIALAWAERYGGIIINADSMQVYRELRILTARPTAEEEARVPHALYGHVPGREAYSVGRWIEDVEAALQDAQKRDLRPIIVGGTGLYFKALLEGLSPIPAIPAPIRAHWRSEAERLGAAALHAVLAEKDPEMAARLSATDTQRITRALEVLDATGRSLADWQREAGRPVLDPDETDRYLVMLDRETLYARCDRRFDAMMAGGALQEVRHLLELDLDPELPILGALGVRPLADLLAGRCSAEAAAAQVKAETRQYAKRQLTWLRRNMSAWSAMFTH
ncbi:MAG TPA: tRNA (adenosine(37)-N6)-dimethylallyltransferase MiaA [Hyphomicrobiaceae bacterium]|nr:tRNA (adenosine(37)-N6)-dimethylallyltransferase MiaA [Hyphomicrobiaceae bacterium]